MPQYQWTSTEPEPHDKGIGVKDTKTIGDTKATKDASRQWESQGARRTSALTVLLCCRVHASNVGRWVTSQGTALGRGNRQTSTSSIATKMTLSSLNPLPQFETRWHQ